MNRFKNIGNVESKKIKGGDASDVENEDDGIPEGYADQFVPKTRWKGEYRRQEDPRYFKSVAYVLHQNAETRAGNLQSVSPNAMTRNSQRESAHCGNELSVGINEMMGHERDTRQRKEPYDA